MFREYKFPYYLSSLIGQVLFSYKIKNNELTFSLSKIKILYSFIIFLVQGCFIVLFTYYSCRRFHFYSFLSASTFFGCVFSWCVAYLNSYFYTNQITHLLGQLYELEQTKEVQKKNTYFLIFIIEVIILSIIFCFQSHMNYDKTKYSFTMMCYIPLYIQYLGNMSGITVHIFILTELRIFAIEEQKCFKSKKKLTSLELESYINKLEQFKKMFKKTNRTSNFPFIWILGISLVNILLGFYVFLHSGLFQVDIKDLIWKLIELYSPMSWFVYGCICTISLICVIEKCGYEIQKFSDMISSMTEKSQIWEDKKVR